MKEDKRFVRATMKTMAVALLTVLVCGSVLAGTITSVATYEYDATKGFLAAKVDNPDDPNLNKRTQYTYDAYGNRLTTVVSSSATGSYAIPTRTVEKVNYDPLSISPSTYINALGQGANIQYDPGNLPLYIEELNGLRNRYEYDSHGRVIKATRPDGNYLATNYILCSTSNPCSHPSAVLVTATVPYSPSAQVNGPTTKKYYDSYNRIIRVETTGFDGNSIVVIDTEYDQFGRVSRTSRPYYAGQTIRWTTYNYDSLGRTVDVTEADGGTIHTNYNGLATTITNALNQKRSTIVDSRGLITQVIDDAGNPLNYQYDAAGRLVQTTDPKGNAVKVAYDLVGNKISMVDPDLGTINYVYDTLGELRQQTDAKGQVVTYQYDLLGRVINRTEPDLVSTWIYDTCGVGKGKLCSTSADNGFKSTQVYDSYGRLSQSTSTIDSDYTSIYTYDTNGRLAKLQYPSGFIVQYNYTSLGYMSEVRNAGTNSLYWKANRMDAEGHLLEQAYGNGVITQQDFDPATGSITAIRAGTNNAVQNLAYTYDKHGNMLTRSDSNQSLWEGFLYDNLNRLTSNSVNSTGAGVITQTYAYDSLGNITSRSDAGNYSYGEVNVRPHAVAQITRANGGIRQFTYDASGNLIQEVERDSANNVIADKGRTETWTSFNMPLNLANASTSIQFVYGTDHQRIKEINPSSTTYFIHPDNSGGLLYEKEYKSATSIEHRHFITAGSAGVVAILKRPYAGAETLIYMHRDNLGSVTAVSDSAGNVTERMAYEPFGKRRTPAGALDPNGVLTGTNTNRGYTNHEELDSLGLVHMNGRVFDPMTARFLTPDLVVQAPENIQAYNRYSYTTNNPLIYYDPSGFSFWTKIRDSVIKPAIAVAIAGPGFAGGLLAGAMTGGNVKSALIGGLTAGAFGVVGDKFAPGDLGNILGHAAVGCAASSVTGGSCKTGALSAGVSAAAAPYVPNDVVGGTIASATIGGTTSAIAGGSFGDGATIGAAGYLFNHWAHNLELAMYGVDAHQTLQAKMELQDLVVESSSAGGRKVDGRFDIANAQTGELWEIKRFSIAGMAAGEVALNAYTNGTGFTRGGDLPGLPVGGAMELRGDKAWYTFQNMGGGLVVYTTNTSSVPTRIPVPFPLPRPRTTQVTD